MRPSAATLPMTLLPDNQNDRNCDDGDKQNQEAEAAESALNVAALVEEALAGVEHIRL